MDFLWKLYSFVSLITFKHNARSFIDSYYENSCYVLEFKLNMQAIWLNLNITWQYISAEYTLGY